MKAQHAADACFTAFRQAEDAAWEVYQDSMLSYDQPSDAQLDLLEVYVDGDSRLTTWVNSLGGRAQRFTQADGDLSTPDRQRKLWDMLQRTQPRHIWMSPDSRLWCSWTSLNSSRNPKLAQNLKEDRQRELGHLSLCAKIFQWQHERQRHFHLEQPVTSKLVKEEALVPVVNGTTRVNVDLCAFGYCTPISQIPVQKRTAVFSTSINLIQSLVSKQCPGHAKHQPLTSRLRQVRGLCQVAGSYCQGFAKHVAQQLLRAEPEAAMALDSNIPPNPEAV